MTVTSRGIRNFTFVEAGAFDGLTGSNVATLEKNLLWQGLCYEPNPVNFARVQQNRPRCKNFNAVLCDESNSTSGKYVNFQVLNPPYDQESGIVDFMMPTKQDMIRNLDHKFIGKKLKLSCRSMSRDITQFISADGHVDFLSLDVEGSELTVLKTIDWAKIQFEVVLAECSHEQEVILFLSSKSYVHVAKVGDDNIFFHTNSPYLSLWKSGCKCRLAGECKLKLVYPDMGWICK